MMTLFEAARKELIRVPMVSTTKAEALEELVDVLCQAEHLQKAPILDAVLRREGLGSTAIGNGVAIPHCKTPDVKGCHVVIGIAPRLIPYDSNEVRIFFLVVANEGQSAAHVQLLSSIARFCSSSVNRNLIATAKTPDAVYQTIEN